MDSVHRPGRGIRIVGAALTLLVGVSTLEAVEPQRVPERPVLIRQIEAHQSAGRWEEAISLLRRALDRAPNDLELRIMLAETLSWGGRFEEAEALFSELVESGPSRRVRIGLARTLQWKGEYGAAVEQYRLLLAGDPGDIDALEGLATTEYWSGDYRSAERHFEAVIAADPSRDQARDDLAAIRTGARTVVTTRAFSRSDDQPYDAAHAEISGIFFSDPLTKWIVTVEGSRLEGEGPAAPGLIEGETASIEVASEIGIPSVRLTVEGAARPFRFADGETVWLGRAAVTRRITTASILQAFYRRDELIRTVSSLDEHPWVASTGLRWSLDRKGWLADIQARSLDFSDGNEGTSASGYVLAPIFQEPVRFSAGVSALYADTDENRFRLNSVASVALPGGGFAYTYEGRYDPYWTPIDLREARVLLSMNGRVGRMTGWRVDGTYGTARDEALAFGPDRGFFPFPSGSFPVSFNRSFEPWSLRAAIEREWSTFSLQFSYDRWLSAEYESEEIGATLVRRF